MTYTEADLQITEPMAYIRQHWRMFLRRIDPRELATAVVECALFTTDGPITVHRVGDWWIVGGDVDWLASGSAVEGRSVFEEIVAFPEAGANSMHAEVLLTAFAKSVVTVTPDEAVTVKGEVGSDDAIWQCLVEHPTWRRAVAFRM
jgi:hypothetical protein